VFRFVFFNWSIYWKFKKYNNSFQFATTLLEEALTKRRWTIARDIVRFLQSIDRKDFEDVPESPLYQKLQPRTANKQPMFLPDGASEDYGLVFNSSSG
jgi:hypothetical protein